MRECWCARDNKARGVSHSRAGKSCRGQPTHLFNGFPQVVRERHSVQRLHRQRHQVTAQLAELLSWSQAGDSGVRGIQRDGRRQPTCVPRTALLAGRPAVGPLGLICFGRVSKQVSHVLEVVPRCQHRGQATHAPTAWRRRLEAPARGRRVQGAAQDHVLGRKHASCGVPKVPPRWRVLHLPRLPRAPNAPSAPASTWMTTTSSSTQRTPSTTTASRLQSHL